MIEQPRPRKPLQRRTPLKPGGPLARKPFPQQQPCVGKTRDREQTPKTPKRRPEGYWPKSKGNPIVLTRSQNECELRLPWACLGGRGHSTHHITDRSIDDSGWPPSGLLRSCGDGTTGCHGWVTDNPKAARELGGWVRGSCDNRYETPVLLCSYLWPGQRRWVVLDDKGDFEQTDPPKWARTWTEEAA